jgi:ribosomal protein L31
MKKDIHPNYREVVFWDLSSDFKFITRSTIETSTRTLQWKMAKRIQCTKSRFLLNRTLSTLVKRTG